MSLALSDGAIFADRYRIVRRLAMGGMGAVYEAVHLETGRRRALKVMHAHMFQSEELRERFKREARIAAQIESEHIVDVSDAGVDEATQMPFMVMELLRGEELSRRLKRAGALTPAEALGCLHQMAMALDRTHAASIVHRDIKPENIFLCLRDDGSTNVKILDFGVAKLVADDSVTSGSTQSLGTPLYMAPEQFRSAVRLTPAADIYALGLLSFTLLTGVPYWRPESRNAGDAFAFAFIAAQGPPEPATVRAAAAAGVTLPPAFDAWFARVTHKDPAQRPQPATLVVRELAAALDLPLPGAGALSLSAPAIAVGMTSLGPASLTEVIEVEPDTSSTGAAVTPPLRRPRGSRIALGGAVVVAALATGAWLGQRTRASDAPVAGAGTASAAAETGSAGLAATAPVPVVAPAEATASAAPPAPPSASAPPPGPRRPSAPGPRAATPPTRPVIKPGSLLGRD